MKIAYLILAHAHPQQLGRLAARLSAPDVHLYLHIDANTPEDVFSAMQIAVAQAELPTVWINRQPCNWGGFSLVEATLRLITAALADKCDWLVLLSGQDYPLQTHEVIVERLENHTGFIDLQDPESFDVRYRHEAFHFERFNGKFAGKLLQKFQRGLGILGVRRTLPVPLTHIRAGSQWWMLSAPVCRWILDFCAAHPQTMAFFHHTLVPDEMFFQTLLWHSPFHDQLSTSSLRRIEWQDGAWSPRTINESDLPQLCIATELFVRKCPPDGKVTALLDLAKSGYFTAHATKFPANPKQ